MLANRNDNTILGTFFKGQGNVVAGKQLCSLYAPVAVYVRGLFLGLGDGIALAIKRIAAAMAWQPAMCWTTSTSCSTRRHQRGKRWLSGVVVDPGTVGVRW